MFFIKAGSSIPKGDMAPCYEIHSAFFFFFLGEIGNTWGCRETVFDSMTPGLSFHNQSGPATSFQTTGFCDVFSGVGWVVPCPS